MNVSIKNTADYKDFSSVSSCEINCIHIKINDIKTTIDELTNTIADTSWINSLDELSKKIFTATAKRTIDKIVNEIIAGISNSVNEDIGEYIVSHTAQIALAAHYSHTRIPLAELLKEKISGNPGFDFHTISTKKFLVFGEAKFSMSSTPRAIALNQIGDFIQLEKDYAELNSLKAFMDADVTQNCIDGMRGYAAAFSFNADDIDTIFQNALDSEIIGELIAHHELYLIAIEIC